MIKLGFFVALVFWMAAPAAAERHFDIDGPMELHIWLTAKPGQEAALEKTFREVFYPAVKSQNGFRSALLMRKPNTSDYTVRLSFDTEEQRMKWVASDEHQKAWPAFGGHALEPKVEGFAVVHPK
jgi:heme-degrading monooxygenase HmoA